MLNLVIQSPFEDQARNPANRVVIPESPRHIRLRRLGIDRSRKCLDVRPQDVVSGFCVSPASVAHLVAVTLEDLLDPPFPLFELAVVG